MSSIGPISGMSPLQTKAVGDVFYAARRERLAKGEFSHSELRAIEELKTRDRQVRQHEQAHKVVGGPYAGTVNYEYQAGPDGKRYVSGGEVPIDVSPVAGDPQATITKMEIVRAAALAPSEPSPQDRAVAQLAQAQLMAAQADLRAARFEIKRDEGMADRQPSSVNLNQPENSYVQVFSLTSDNEQRQPLGFA